jgi:hypothetical protein
MLWDKYNKKPRLGIPTNWSCSASCRGKKEKEEEEGRRERKERRDGSVASICGGSMTQIAQSGIR